MTIEIVCHRGANEYAPENTYASAQLCIDWGVDYVEVDVSTSKDGVLYLLHGPTMSRTTNGKGIIGQLMSSEIDQLDAGGWFDSQCAGEPVPRLEPFLRWIKGKAKVFLDIKAAQHQPLLDIIYQTGFEQECFFWSTSYRWMRELRKMAPDLALKVNANTASGVAKAAVGFRANIVEVELRDMNESILEACRNYERHKDRAAYQQIIEWGADMVNLNHADHFLEVAQLSSQKAVTTIRFQNNPEEVRPC